MIRINLLKPEKKELKEAVPTRAEEIKEKKKTDLSPLIILPFIAIIGFLFITQKNSIDRERALLDKAKKEKRKLQYVFSKLQELERQKALYERKINLINRLKSRQGTPVIIMDELSRNLPDWVWLTKVTYKNQMIQIKGNAISNNLIADYILNLENSPYFHNVNLIASTQRKIRNDQIQEFSMTVRYTPPQLPSLQPRLA